MASPEQSDYFFIESNENDRATMYARGEGLEVVSALARISLLQYGHEGRADYAPRFGGSHYDNVYDYAVEALAGTESAEPQPFVKLTVSALALTDIMHLGQSLEFSHLLDEHNTKLLGRIRDGARSPDSVHREIMTQVEDKRLLIMASRLWFNEDGLRVVVSTTQQRRMGESASRLLLRRITRNSAGLEFGSKEALFQKVPKKGKAYIAKGVAFKRSAQRGLIDQRRPFMHGGRAQDVYGYIAPDSKEFVPVLKQVSDEPPAHLFLAKNT
jgi:hypothetical protein